MFTRASRSEFGRAELPSRVRSRAESVGFNDFSQLPPSCANFGRLQAISTELGQIRPYPAEESSAEFGGIWPSWVNSAEFGGIRSSWVNSAIFRGIWRSSAELGDFGGIRRNLVKLDEFGGIRPNWVNSAEFGRTR